MKITLKCSETKENKYIQSRSEFVLKKQLYAKRLHRVFNTSRHMIPAWRFHDNLKTKLSVIIFDIRNKEITYEILKEIKKERKLVHNFTQHTFNGKNKRYTQKRGELHSVT